MSRYSMKKYPYADGTEPEAAGYCRFMDVNLDDFLGRVSEKVMADCPMEICGDMRKLHEAATSEDPDDRRIIWHVNNHGTHMMRERETFIQDTPAYNYMTKDKGSSPDMHGYIIEVKGYGRMRRAYLREHRPILYSKLLLGEKLFPHLREIDEAAQNRLTAIADREIAHEVICTELVYDCA